MDDSQFYTPKHYLDETKEELLTVKTKLAIAVEALEQYAITLHWFTGEDHEGREQYFWNIVSPDHPFEIAREALEKIREGDGEEQTLTQGKS